MKRHLSQPTWLSLVLALTVCFGSTSPTIAQEDADQKAPPVAEQDDFDLAVHLESFDYVWDTIKRVHWDSSLVGESWDAAREKFRPQVENATSIDDVREIIGELLNTLEQSHFGVIPKDSYDSMNDDGEEDTSGSGVTGMEIRHIEKRLVVTRVHAGMPAQRAGVQPGWEVKMIGKRTSDLILKRATITAEHSVMRVDTSVGLICDSVASGEIGGELPMVFIDNNGTVVLKHIDLVDGPGQMEQFGNLPPMKVHFQSRQDNDRVGYLAFNAFIGAPRLMKQYKQALVDFHDAEGLIIDMRGNHGGLVILVSGMCNFFATDKDPIGTMTQSGGTVLKLTSNPRKIKVNGERMRFDRPVAVLTDSCSISAAEIMAGGIKDLKLGRVFGGTTAGLSLPSTVVKLPNGDGFQFAIASYVSASGESIEGIGVIPNEPIELTREVLAEQGDPVLEAAKKWILEQNEGDQ